MVRLGQNFLADPNLLEAIVREAAPASDDVVLEVGGGAGALSTLLAPAVDHLHIVELDQRLEPELEEIATRHDNVSLHWGDALRLDLAALEPAPKAMIANLPYSIAAPLLLETIVGLPRLETWTVMVQREVAERLRARAGSRTYGAPSAVAQLGCEVRMIRAVNPAVFKPRPRVESALLRMRRIAPAPDPAVVALIRDAFAHRRKPLPRSLELAARRRETEAERAGEPPPRPRSRELRHRAIEALGELGLPAEVRAEALAPSELASLAAAIRRGAEAQR